MQAASLRQSNYACVANVHMLVEAYRNPSFAEVVKNAKSVAPDGMPLVWALRLLYGIKQERVAGMDLMPDLLHKLETTKLSAFFYGGTEELLYRTKGFIQKKYPCLNVAGMYSPPFRPLVKEEENGIAAMINNSGAHVVFVALGCPKQEKWMASMRGKIKAVMIGIGGALPVMVGMQSRAPKWMQKYGLEWLFRLMQEPKRLFKRYAVTNSVFLYLLMKEYMAQKFFRKAF